MLNNANTLAWNLPEESNDLPRLVGYARKIEGLFFFNRGLIRSGVSTNLTKSMEKNGQAGDRKA